MLVFHLCGVAGAAVVAAVGMQRTARLAVSAAAGAAAGAAFVHVAVAPEHFREWWGFGTFFVVCGAAQLAWALLAGRRDEPLVVAIGLAGSLALVGLWALSRTSGLPLGPEPGVAEAAGTPDVAAVVLELATAAGCARALTTSSQTRNAALATAGALLAACTTAIALLSI